MMTPYLSASQVEVLMRCPREWIHAYICKYPTEKADALKMGTAFHKLMEGEEPDLAGLDEGRYPYRAALSVMGAAAKEALDVLPEVLAKEVKVETDEFKGFVDGVLLKPSGKWQILDFKTCTTVYEHERFLIPHDVQMNAYVAHREELSESLDLMADDFDGVVYMKVRKPLQKRKKAEGIEDFARRLTSGTVVWTYQKEHFARAPEIFGGLFAYAKIIRDYAFETYENGRDPLRVAANTKACLRYGKPCPFFGMCFPEANARDAAEEVQEDQAENC